MNDVPILRWEGCYDSSWKGLITDASFAHPAKFSRGLIERIYDHCLAQGYLKRGDIVADVFGGIGTGGITAAYRGLNWIGCELEPRFVEMARENFKLHLHGWFAVRGGSTKIIQGDSRKFDEHVSAIVSSPPYASGLGHGGGDPNHPICIEKKISNGARQYGDTVGQIGSLKSGAVDSVISSPPFTQGYQGGGGINKNGYTARPDLGTDWVGKRTYQGQGGDRASGNIETLKEGTVDACISSPPYSDIAAGAGGLNTKPAKHPGQQSGRKAESASQDTDQRYGTSAGQISQLKCGNVNACVSSPPWESNCEGVMKASKFKDPEAFAKAQSTKGNGCSVKAKLKAMAADESRDSYGQTEGQIGKEQGQTYWEAVRDVYCAAFRCIRPGGVIVLVTKDYCKAGKRVRLSDDTCRLLEHIGFVPIERVHAMLVTETVEAGLFGEEKTSKERKSFFRRNHESKVQAAYHWPEIDNKEKWLELAKAQVSNPTDRKVLTKAQVLAWRDAGEPWIDLETMIDHEDVLIYRRP